MKLNVQGIEEIELTDPQGLCNPPVPQLPSGPGLPARPSNPIPPNQPGWPTPSQPTPEIRGLDPGPPIYIRKLGDPLEHPTKWGVGGEAIQRAGEQVDKEKWEKNWQASVGGDVPDDGNRSTH